MRLIFLLFLLLAPLSAQRLLLPEIVQQHSLDKRTRVVFHVAITEQLERHFAAELHPRIANAETLPTASLMIRLRDEGSNRWSLDATVWSDKQPNRGVFIGQADCKTVTEVVDFIGRIFPTAVPELKKLLAESE